MSADKPQSLIQKLFYISEPSKIERLSKLNEKELSEFHVYLVTRQNELIKRTMNNVIFLVWATIIQFIIGVIFLISLT
jgi:hypothetical protein